MNAPLRRTAALAVAFLTLAAPVAARVLPAPLTATFKDRERNDAGTPPAPLACAIHFTEVSDKRPSPEIAGVIDGRKVLPPPDVQAWLVAVLGGLKARGVPAQFGPVEGAATIPTAQLELKLAWVSDTPWTFTGNVVVHLTAGSPKGETLDRVYRGRAIRTAGWSSGVDTMQSAIDGAFADALNQMAPDLTKLCTA